MELLILTILTIGSFLIYRAQTNNFTSVSVSVDFSKKLQDCDGFDANYLQATHSVDYKLDSQDNGGFYRLSEKERLKIAEEGIFEMYFIQPPKIFLNLEYC